MNDLFGFPPDSRTPAESGGVSVPRPSSVPPASSDPIAPGDRTAGEPAFVLRVQWAVSGVMFLVGCWLVLSALFAMKAADASVMPDARLQQFISGAVLLCGGGVWFAMVCEAMKGKARL